MILHKLNHLLFVISSMNGCGKHGGGIVSQRKRKRVSNRFEVDIEAEYSQILCNSLRDTFGVSFASREENGNSLWWLTGRLPFIFPGRIVV